MVDTVSDVNVQLSPGQRVVVHNPAGEPLIALTVEEVGTVPRGERIRLTFRSDRQVIYSAQEWPEDGDPI